MCTTVFILAVIVCTNNYQVKRRTQDALPKFEKLLYTILRSKKKRPREG